MINKSGPPHVRNYIDFLTIGWVEIKYAWSPRLRSRISGAGAIAEGIVGYITEEFWNWRSATPPRVGKIAIFPFKGNWSVSYALHCSGI